MRFGLPLSFVLHGGIIAWALIGLERTSPFKPPEPEPVEVAIISEDGLTRLKQGDRNAKQLEAAPAKPAPDSKAVKEAPKAKPPEPSAPPPPPPEPAKVEPPPPPPPKAAEVPPPPPKAPEPPARDEIAELALKAEQDAALEAARRAEEERKRQEAAKKAADDKKKRDELAKKAAEKKKQEAEKKAADEKKRLAEAKKKEDFFEDMQKALKDNDPNKRAPPPPGAQVASVSKIKGPTAGAPEGQDTQLTASQANLIGAMFKKAVSRCWNINSGGDGVDKIKIEVEIKLSPDGRIIGTPRVVSRGSGPLYADMSNSALRALVQCEPYDLPKQLYKGGWDFMIVEFDPSRMY